MEPVEGLGRPDPSGDGQGIQVIVPMDIEDGWETSRKITDQVRSIAADQSDGLSMHVTSPIGFGADSSEAFAGIDGKLLYAAMAVVILILLITYRSPILWLIPLISAGAAPLHLASGDLLPRGR